MFFEGTLHEGIATALQQGKLVVCFVTDGQDESQQWETQFLGDSSLSEPLSTQAVVLKLQAGSTEAGYLAAIFPLPKTPTLVIIKNGELKEYIAAGVSKQDFVSRTAKALGAAPQQQTPTATDAVPSQGTMSSSPSAQPPTPSPSSSSAQPSAPTQPAAPPQPSSSSSSTPPPPAQTPSTVQTLLTERAARLEAQRKKEAEQRRLDKGKAKESKKPAADPDSAQSKHAEELKRRQKQARDDRARVLQAIADDKAARRARVSEREAERARMQAEDNRPAVRKEDDGSGGMCTLQVRMFDGSTVRSRFPATASLAREVRRWLDEEKPGLSRAVGAGGFGFKVVMTPLPSRSVGAREEGKSLAELGLAPSATLVLVPVLSEKKGVTARAYPRAGGGNAVTRAVMAVVGVVMGLWALVVSFFGSLFGTAAAPLPEREGDGVGMATGREQRRDETQFYNGNSTNFEPRKDDDDE